MVTMRSPEESNCGDQTNKCDNQPTGMICASAVVDCCVLKFVGRVKNAKIPEKSADFLVVSRFDDECA